jgi:hypothetical protein
MSGKDEEPIKDFPSCPSCERNGRRFIYWCFTSPEGLAKNIYFNPGIGKVLHCHQYEILPVPIYTGSESRMCTLKELDAIGNGPIVCHRCRESSSLNIRASIIRVARRMIIKYEGKLK